MNHKFSRKIEYAQKFTNHDPQTNCRICYAVYERSL